MIDFTNVPDDSATVYHLAKQGYGSIVELEAMDAPEFLDLVEFEQIQQDIERYHMQKRDG